MDETRKRLLMTMGFSEKAISVLDQELNMRQMEDPSVTEEHQGTCGDILMLSLKMDQDRIANAQYEYIGCAGLQACASAMTEMVKGKNLDQAAKVEVDDIIEYLVSIPEKKYECAEIARDTLRKAIKKWSGS